MNPVKKILILAANPKNTPRLRFDEEVREIKEGLRLSKYGDQFEIHSELAVRFRDIRRALLEHKPHIVHFIGHGEKKGLMVEDKLGVSVRFSSKVLSGLFKLFSNQVECVILSACYSTRQTAAINKHINYVIGMRKEIRDKTAVEFAVGFYDALGAGESIEKAFEFGCNAIEFLDLPEHLLPVLKKKKDPETLKGETGTLMKKISIPISSHPPPHSQSIPHTTSREENVEIQVNVKDKRKVIVSICISLIFLITVFVFIYRYLIGPSNNNIPDKKVIAQLTEYLNSRMHGSQYKIDPETTIVKPVGNNCYQITLKNSVFITDLTESVNLIYKYLSTSDGPYSEMESGRMEEVTMIYGPGENFLRLLSIKGLSVEGDLSDAKGINKSPVFGGFEPDKISISIGKITNQYPEGYDSGSSETMEHLKIQLSGLTAKKDNISILLDIEKIGKVDTGKEEGNISDYLSDPNAQLPNLQTALDTGAAINDLNIQLGKVNISVKKNGSKLCEGVIENASYSQFMKPDDTGKFFKFGQGIQLKNLKLSIPENKKLQLLTRVKEFCYVYSINNLSQGATLAFLDLLKNSFTLRNQVDSTGINEYMTLVTKFFFEVMKSKVHIRFSISPFKHYFGEIEVTADIKLYNLMAGPIVTIEVTLFKVADILSKLKEANVFSASILQQIEQFIEKQAVKKDNGDASIIYEWNIQQLSKFLSNINPQMINPLMIR